MAPGPPTVGWPLASRPRPLRAQDLFAPKTSSRPRPLRAQDLFAPKTSSSPRPLRGQNRPPAERFAFAWPTTRGRAALFALGTLLVAHGAQPSLGRRSVPLHGKSPANTLSALSAGAPALVEKACAIRCPRPVPKNNGVLEMLGKRVKEMDRSELILFIPIAKKEVAFVKKSLLENWQSRPRQGQGGGREYHISPFMGSRGLVPLRGVGQRPTIFWRKQEAGCARGARSRPRQG